MVQAFQKVHKEVYGNAFRFSEIIITAVGYLVTFQYFVFSSSDPSRYIHSGFVMMMVLNVLFPHLAATIIMRRYAPGTLTGMLLIAPIGVYILIVRIGAIDDLIDTLLSCMIITSVVLTALHFLLRIGDSLFDRSKGSAVRYGSDPRVLTEFQKEVDMKIKFDMIGIFVMDLSGMVDFYKHVVGIETDWDGAGPFAEFRHEIIRFSMFERAQLPALLGREPSYPEGINGTFELAINVGKPEMVDSTFQRMVAGGARPVYDPRDEPWKMRSSMVADPEGNLIEIASDFWE